jgi:serine/threonine-protein kinase
MEELAAKGQLFANKYEIVRPLGRGGMGVVYEAIHKKIGQAVAIKILRPEFAADEQAVRRFEREAVAIGRLQSEYVVRVFDVDVTADGRPFLVMELLKGRDLGEEMKGESPSVERLVDWVIQICIGVAAAHRARVVHRDLKPSNVFLTGKEKTARILDFGVSKLVGAEQDLTTSVTSIGTPRYMAPEQVRGDRDVDALADIWSVGVILYRMLSGAYPFDAGPDAPSVSTAIAILSSDPMPLGVRCPALPEALCNLVMEMLQKDRWSRPRSALLVADRLAPFGSGSVVIPDEPRTRSDPPLRDDEIDITPRSWPMLEATRRDDPEFPVTLQGSGQETATQLAISSAPGAAATGSAPKEKTRRRVVLMTAGGVFAVGAAIGIATFAGGRQDRKAPSPPTRTAVEVPPLDPGPALDLPSATTAAAPTPSAVAPVPQVSSAVPSSHRSERPAAPAPKRPSPVPTAQAAPSRSSPPPPASEKKKPLFL